MTRTDEDVAGNMLLAFLLGAVSGAAIALLYAPASGRDTRGYIGNQAREAKNRAVQAAERGRGLINQGRDMITQGRETISNALERGREAYQQARAQEQTRGQETE